MTLTKGTLIPNWPLVLSDGRALEAWHWRQRSNLVLIAAPRSSAEERRRWQAGIDAEKKQWIWLQAEVVIVTTPAPDLPEGVHAVDRYGQWIRAWPLDQWTFDDVQREYVYYEARHC